MRCCRAVLGLSLLFTFTACSRKTPAPPKVAGTAAPEGRPGPIVAAATREREARALLDRWLAAQNAGNFDDYQALYADRFEGVRRSGTRTRQMDRAGWMADRKRMFRKPMAVAMSDIKLHLGAGSANVHFVQTWESGKYKDVGPKRLLLVRDKQGWHIAQEEMLSSTRLAAHKPGDDFLLVYQNAPVLSVEVDHVWAQGPRTMEGFVGHQAVSEARLPEELRRWRGAKLELFDKEGRRCTANVSGFELTAQAEWHFGTVESWRSGEVPQEAIAEEVWSQGKVLLQARLGEHSGGCKDPVFARRISESASPVVPFVKAEGALAAEVSKRAAGLLKTELGPELPGLVVATLPGEPERALAFLSVDPETCSPEESATGEFIWSANLSARGPGLALRQQGDSDFRQALLAVDLDGDGEWEIIYSGWPRLRVGVLKWQGGKYEDTLGVEIPYYDCPC